MAFPSLRMNGIGPGQRENANSMADRAFFVTIATLRCAIQTK
jgi:hypothetical protein